MFSVALIAAVLCLQPVAQPGSPLSGPAVAPAAERPTLVHYDFNSRLRRPETSPEQAAILLLKLPPEQQSEADAVLTRRASLIDEFVAKNLFLLQELDTASRAGDKLDQFTLLMRALGKLRPVIEPGPLRTQIASVLPAPDAARFKAVVDEYWAAAVAESLRDTKTAGKKAARWQIDLGERFRHLSEEIVRSYERQAASGTIVVDYMMNGLDLTPEQTRTINNLKLEMLRRTGVRPTEKDQQQLVVGSLAYLNERQRVLVIKRLQGK